MFFINILVPSHLMSVQFHKCMTDNYYDSGIREYSGNKYTYRTLPLTLGNSGINGEGRPKKYMMSQYS